MKLKNSINSIFILFGVLYWLPLPAISAESSQSKDAKAVEALVNSAATLIEAKGKNAFAEFRKKDSKWFTAKTYVFVDDINGNVLVNPPSPEIEGKNLIDWKDAKGKELLREFIKVAKSKGSGWVDYWWRKCLTENLSS
jgi:cytochrome c